MDTRKRTAILIVLLLVLAAVIYVTVTSGDPLRKSGESRRPGELPPTWVKPTTDMLEYFRGTATAEAERATPEPQTEDTRSPGAKTTPRPSLWEWWDEFRLPANWGNA